MSVNFEHYDIDETNNDKVQRRRTLISLARRSGIREPEPIVDGVEALLDGELEIELPEHGRHDQRLALIKALSILYQDGSDGATSGVVHSGYMTETPLQDTPYDDRLLPDDSEERARVLPRPLQNLFRGILDDELQGMVAGFTGTKADLMAIEMGRIHAEHAERPSLAGKHAYRIKQLLEGVPPRRIAAAEGIAETSIYTSFQYNLPKIYKPHAQRIVEAVTTINDMPEMEGEVPDPWKDIDRLFPAPVKPQRPPRVAKAKPVERKSSKERTKAVVSRPAPRNTTRSKRVVSTEAGSAKSDADRSLDGTGQYLKKSGRRALLSAFEEVELAKDIEAGLYAEQKLAWLQGEDVGAFASRERHELTAQEGRDLGRMARRGTEAYNHLLEANLRLVVSLAKRYTGHGMSFDDLIQEGNLGVIRAAEKFDFTKGFKFSTYATWWIRQAITRGMADQARTIRLPVHFVEQVNKLARIRREMHQTLGREATHEELAAESGIPVDKVVEILEHSRDPVSLDMPVGTDEEAPLGDFVADEQHSIVDEVSFRIMQEKIELLIDGLEGREALVVRERFGLKDGEPKTLDEIGKILGVTRERVRQIEKKVMARLRHPSMSHHVRDFLE